jgi:ketosteroid isomerase-like protein
MFSDLKLFHLLLFLFSMKYRNDLNPEYIPVMMSNGSIRQKSNYLLNHDLLKLVLNKCLEFYKTKTMRQISILFFGLFLLTSCNKISNSATNQLSPVDSLIGEWIKNWNNHDSIAVKNMFDADVILIDDNMIAKSQEEVVSKMIRPHIESINNIKAEKIKEWVSADRALYTGTYSLDIFANGSLTDQHKGFWTVAWKKNDKDEWKICNVHINTTEIQAPARKE